MNTEVTNLQIVAWLNEAGINAQIGEQDFTTPLSDIGIDSLDFFSILEVLELRTGVVISDDAATQLRTIEDLRDFVCARGAGS